jgi:hypothetical protein
MACEAYTFEDQVRLLVKISVEVLQTQFGAQCEPCLRVSDARPFVNGAHQCEAEIELQHAPNVAPALIDIVIARYGDDIGSRVARHDLQVIAITDESRHLEWRTLEHVDPMAAATVEDQLIRRILANIDWLLHGRHNALEASAIYDKINATGFTATRDMVPQLVDLLRDRLRARATATIAQSSSSVPVTDTLGRLYFFVKHVIVPRLNVMLSPSVFRDAFDQSIECDLHAICVELIISYRAELLQEAGVVVEQNRLSCSAPFIRLLRSGALDLAEPAFGIARDFVDRQWPESLRRVTAEWCMVEARSLILWRRYHAAAFATLCIGLGGVLPCGELLMQVFLESNCNVPRIFLHKAIGIVFPSASAPQSRRRASDSQIHLTFACHTSNINV